MLNFSDASAWTYGAHGEVEGKPGYTGRWPSDRMQAAEFPGWGGAEIMGYRGDPVASVDAWMATIYHRVIPLDPSERYTGYGHGRNDRTAVDVMDFGSGQAASGLWTMAIPYPLAYPADGQIGVPLLWGGGEAPDPLPPGASRPVGYPFTLQGLRGTLKVTRAVMRDEGGQRVAIHPNPPDCATFNCYALIAVAPLQPNHWYSAFAKGTVGGVGFKRTWRFMTGNGSEPGQMGVQPGERVGPPWQRPW
jgi:hypothetical protein